MVEIKGNIWDHLKDGFIVIPTNGDVDSKGAAVMGRGLALQCKTRFKDFEYQFGHNLKKLGNVPMFYYGAPAYIITFPVKHHWYERADLGLIEESTRVIAQAKISGNIYLPRVGCGNGSLHWNDVKPILEKYLTSDRFVVVNYA